MTGVHAYAYVYVLLCFAAPSFSARGVPVRWKPLIQRHSSTESHRNSGSLRTARTATCYSAPWLAGRDDRGVKGWLWPARLTQTARTMECSAWTCRSAGQNPPGLQPLLSVDSCIGAASNHASRCWNKSQPMAFQLRRSCILNPRPEPKID